MMTTRKPWGWHTRYRGREHEIPPLSIPKFIPARKTEEEEGNIMQLNVKFSEDAEVYLDSCARIRNMSRSRLLQNMLEIICNDRLVLSVLDDDSKPSKQQSRHTHYRRLAGVYR